MTWYKVKDWNYKNYNDGNLGISIVKSEKINESEISDIVYDTILNSVVDDMIDDCYSPINICDFFYSPSFALKSTDPLAYDQLKDDCCELKIDEIVNYVNEMATIYKKSAKLIVVVIDENKKKIAMYDELSWLMY